MNLSQLEEQYGLPPGLLAAIQGAEGSGPTSVSPKGAVGTFQFMPATAKAYGLTDPTDPEASAVAAAKYMADAMRRYKTSDPRVLMAEYNGGPRQAQAVLAGREPPARETQNYIKKAPAADPMNWLRANAPAQPSAASDDGMAWLRANAPQTSPQRAKEPSTDDIQRAMLTRNIASAAPFGISPDMAMGARQVLDAGAQMAARGLTAVTSPESGIGQWARQQQQATERANQTALDQYNSTYAPQAFPGSDAMRVVGQALATAPVLPLRAASGMIAATAQGAGLGAATSALTPTYNAGDDFWQQKLAQAKQGAKLGAIAGGGLNVLGRVISPNTSAAVKTMMDENITPTLGQTLGGVFKTAEEKAASLPIVGDAIRYAQGKGLVDFNRAVYDRILAPIGQKYEGPIGQEGIAKVGDRLSSAYDDVLNTIPMVAVDKPFGAQTLQLQQMAKSLPPQQAQRFNDIVQGEVWNRLTPAGTLSGTSMKEMESKLGQIAKGYRGSPDFDTRQLGAAVSQVQANLRAMVARQFPDQAQTLQAVNQGWSQLTQLERAANTAAVAKREGIITPSDYLRAIKQSDNSVRDRAFARGEMKNQDFAQAADQVLSNKYPDSGTAGRALFNAGVAGAGAYFTPGVLAGLGAASLPYLPGMRQLVATALARRPDFAGLLAAPLKQAAPYLGMAAPMGLPRPRIGGLLELANGPDQQ
jgi:hypothetical protein